MVWPDFLARVEVAFNHHAFDASTDGQRLVDAARFAAAAIHSGASVGALNFSLRTSGIGLGLVKVFARNDASLKELALALQSIVAQAGIGARFGGVGLCHAEVRRGQLRQHRTRVDGQADVGLNSAHAAGEGGVNALCVLLVPDHAGRQVNRDGLCWRGADQTDQGQLRMVGRKAQLLTLQDRRRGFGRRFDNFLATGQNEQADEKAGAKSWGAEWFHGEVLHQGQSEKKA